MDIALEKKAHVFRLPVSLLEKLKELARKDRRSLNNYVECLLLDAVYNEPNEETLASLEEAKAGVKEIMEDKKFGNAGNTTNVHSHMIGGNCFTGGTHTNGIGTENLTHLHLCG